MSKVFSAKKEEVEFKYEFLDGKEVSLKTRSLSSKQQREISKMMSEKDSDTIDNFKSIIEMQLKTNDKKTVEKIINEQYEEGDIIQFSNSLTTLIKEETEKK